MNQPTNQSKAEVWLHAADICDFSAMQAINGLGDDYRAVGKHLRLRRLRPRSVRLLSKGVRR